MTSTTSASVRPFLRPHSRWDRSWTVMRLRSRFESPGLSQTSPNRTLSVSSASLGGEIAHQLLGAGWRLIDADVGRCRRGFLSVNHGGHTSGGQDDHCDEKISGELLQGLAPREDPHLGSPASACARGLVSEVFRLPPLLSGQATDYPGVPRARGCTALPKIVRYYKRWFVCPIRRGAFPLLAQSGHP